jgi:hypothetical protein
VRDGALAARADEPVLWVDFLHYARRCAELAVLAATPEEREHFLSLESAWIRFTAELESAEAFLKTMDEIDFKQPYPLEAA